MPELSCKLIEEGTPHRNGVGALRSIGGGGIRMLERITDYSPNRGYSYQIEGGTLPLNHNGGTVSIEDHGTHCDVEWTTEFAVRSPVAAGALTRASVPLLEFSLQRILSFAKRTAEEK